MAFPTGWGRKQKITVDNTKVSGSGSHTDLPTLITLDHLDSEIVDAGSNSALNGGGDVRFSSDSAGTTQLDLDVVSFITNATPASRECEMWVKIPSVSTSVDTDIYIWYNKTGESQPAVTASFGRNAVWSGDYAIVVHAGEGSGDLVNSTGNSDFSAVGSTITYGSTGKISSGVDLQGGYFEAPQDTAFDLDATSSFHISAWVNLDSTQGAWVGLIAKGDSSAGDWAVQRQSGSDTLYLTNASNTVASVWDDFFGAGLVKLDIMWTGTDNEAYKNGVLLTSDVSSGTPATASSRPTRIGASRDPLKMEGIYEEIRVRKTAPSSDWITTEHANQNSPSTFATAGTPEAAGGGGATIPIMAIYYKRLHS